MMKRNLRSIFLAIVATAVVASFAFRTTGAASAEATASDVFDAVLKLTSQIPGEARTSRSLGTERQGHAVVIDSNGLALTIGYLILEAESVNLTTKDGKVVPAEILAYDHNTGFGMVRALQPLGIKPVRMGDSARAEGGVSALAVVHGGMGNAVPVNIVSRRDFSGYWEYILEDAISTSPLFPSFGGAALINQRGYLIGIGSLIIPNAGDPDSNSPGNMFVPINAIKPIMADLLDQGRSEKKPNPWIGIYTNDQQGFLIVQRLADGGPSAKAGVEVGDIIVSVGNKPVKGQMDFYRKLWATGGPGTEISLGVLKPGKGLQILPVTAGDRYRWLRMSRGN